MEHVRTQAPTNSATLSNSPETNELIALMHKIEENTARAAKGRNLRNLLLAVCALGLVLIAIAALVFMGNANGLINDAKDTMQSANALIEHIDMDKLLKLADDIDTFILTAESMLGGINQTVIQAEKALESFNQLDMQSLNETIGSFHTVVTGLNDIVTVLEETVGAFAGLLSIF